MEYISQDYTDSRCDDFTTTDSGRTASEVSILLIDENTSEALATKKLLTKISPENTNIHRVKNLRAAVQLIQQEYFDFALFIYHLGSPNGLASLSALRNADKDLPVLLISNVELNELEAESLNDNGFEFFPMSKLNLSNMEKTLRKYIDKVLSADVRLV